MNRSVPRLLALAFLILLILPVKVFAKCALTAEEGETCKLHVTELRPTQFSVGMLAVDCKRKKIESKSKKKLKNWLRDSDRQVPAVVGPDGEFYITDHHHLATALYRATPEKDKGWGNKEKVMYVTIVHNFYDKGDITEDQFWSAMLENHWAWMHDNKGLAPMNPRLLPADLSAMLNDPYRTLSRWVRESCGYLKTGKGQCTKFGPGGSKWFMEFVWADFLRAAAPIPVGTAPVCDFMPYGKDCLDDEAGALISVYPRAMWAAKSEHAKQYFESAGLNPAEYGFNAGGQHLSIKISADGCEEVPE